MSLRAIRIRFANLIRGSVAVALAGAVLAPPASASFRPFLDFRFTGCNTGDLAFVDGTCQSFPQLGAPADIAVSPAFGTSLYAVDSGADQPSGPGAIAEFSRDPNTGALTYEGCVTGSQARVGECAPTGSSYGFTYIRGLTTAYPDKVYAVADPASLLTFSIATSGLLTYEGCISGDSGAGPGSPQNCTLLPNATPGGGDSGLASPKDVVVSSDPSHSNDFVYVSSAGDSAIARFESNSSTPGSLSYLGCVTGEAETGPNGSGACEQIASHSHNGVGSGMLGIGRLAITPDGRSLYGVAAGDSSVVRFDRNPETGALAYLGCFTGDTTVGPPGSGACQLIPSATGGGAFSGLDHVGDLALMETASGSTTLSSNLYVSGRGGVAHFARNSYTGSLSYLGCLSGFPNWGPNGSGACQMIRSGTVQPVVHGPILASYGALSVYVGAGGGALARFTVNSSNGNLRYSGCLAVQDFSPHALGGRCNFLPPSGQDYVGPDFSNPVALAQSQDSSFVYELAQDGLSQFSPGSSIATFSRSGAESSLPETSLVTEVPQPSTRSRKASFAFDSSQPPYTTFECAEWRGPQPAELRMRPCASPEIYAHLKPGHHTFEVQATNPTGASDPTPARYEWRIKR